MASSVQGEGLGIIYKVAFFSTIGMLVIIPLQIAVFAAFPLPRTVLDWFLLFKARPLIGFFHADFFILVNNVLMVPIYLAFYQSLKGNNKGFVQLALVLGLVGIAGYLSSNRSFELLALSKGFFAAANDEGRSMFLAAGQAMVVGWQGTAFDAYYVLNGITLVLVAIAMLTSREYGRATAVIGLIAGCLMALPSTAGTLGLVFSLLSLLPWYVFAIRFSMVFRRLGREAQGRDLLVPPSA
jgi:hypothetical protein